VSFLYILPCISQEWKEDAKRDVRGDYFIHTAAPNDVLRYKFCVYFYSDSFITSPLLFENSHFVTSPNIARPVSSSQKWSTPLRVHCSTIPDVDAQFNRFLTSTKTFPVGDPIAAGSVKESASFSSPGSSH
jgi:hypothetical protein